MPKHPIRSQSLPARGVAGASRYIGRRSTALMTCGATMSLMLTVGEGAACGREIA